MFSQGKYVAKNETVLLELLSQILKNKLEHLPWLLLGNKIKQQHVFTTRQGHQLTGKHLEHRGIE